MGKIAVQAFDGLHKKRARGYNTPMTIDHLITKLEEIRSEHGGELHVYTISGDPEGAYTIGEPAVVTPESPEDRMWGSFIDEGGLWVLV